MTQLRFKTAGFRAAALALALAVGALALAGPAEARKSRAPAIIGGVIAGIIIGKMLQNGGRYYHDGRYYYYPPPPPYYGPARVYRYYAPMPWTPEWYAYCTRKYRSFDPASGTYQPYHGPRRLCR